MFYIIKIVKNNIYYYNYIKKNWEGFIENGSKFKTEPIAFSFALHCLYLEQKINKIFIIENTKQVKKLDDKGLLIDYSLTNLIVKYKGNN